MNKTDALIIGAGPTGLFTAHQLKLIGLDCEIVDNLDKIGGQCIELYPDKPIYDIPAVPECTGEELTNNLINQLKPFDIKFHLSERVDEVKKENENWVVKTNNGKIFLTPNEELELINDSTNRKVTLNLENFCPVTSIRYVLHFPPTSLLAKSISKSVS